MNSFRRAGVPREPGQGSASGSGQSASPLAGTRPSLHAAGVTLVSSGLASLDEVLGGGIPLGTVLLMEQDRLTSYGLMLQRFFLAQGVMSGHALCVAAPGLEFVDQLNADEGGESGLDKFVSGLMRPATSSRAAAGGQDKDDDDVELGAGGKIVSVGGRSVGRSQRTLGSLRDGAGDERMRIAWRYEGMRKVSDLPSGNAALKENANGRPFCSAFDITKKMDRSMLAQVPLVLLDEQTLSQTGRGKFVRALECIRNAIRAHSGERIVRIVVHGLLGLGWTDSCCADANAAAMFVHALRAAVRGQRAVCIAGVCGDCCACEKDLRRLRRVACGSVQIDSVSGSSDRRIGDLRGQALVRVRTGVSESIRLLRVRRDSRRTVLRELEEEVEEDKKETVSLDF